ncbi:hypothetical protein HAX54_038666 [Datura stramonium]|uniref:Uncharacterized protein n=1 Tax=Datura stramonium TaxID=4076 RepID=A0ABS8VLG9_DATST|nr:hypothetical protein [Datura stramonium]
MLILRYEFEVEITDTTGTRTATVSDKLAERMLSMTAEQIYETIVFKKQLLPVEHIRQELSQKWFKIHLQKSLRRTPDRTPGSLLVLSYSQKQNVFDLPQCTTTITIADKAPTNSRQHRKKLEVYNEVLRRLKESNNAEAQQPGFDDKLRSHFNRLHTR